MLFCIQPDGPQATEFDLLLQNPDILDNQPAAMYTITYHLTAEDAENGVNFIPTMHTNTSNPQQIFARLVHNHIPLCHDVVSFNLRVSEYPVLEMELDYVLCIDENTKRIYADPGYTSYEWSTGETTRAITVTEAGNYWVKVGNQYDGIICETTADISVVLSGPPETWSLNIQDWTDNENSISVSTTGAGVYEYSIDNVNYQDDPYFGHLETGVYTVYIRDKNGCGMISQELALLNYPKFFTPNGDGINEKWRLEYSWFEPEALIYIYDRYGKLLSSFTAKDPGWDGKFNERNLPATDYWFVVERKEGKIYKGHFSMIR
jgi:gliding motility-associated-like protein